MIPDKANTSKTPVGLSCSIRGQKGIYRIVATQAHKGGMPTYYLAMGKATDVMQITFPISASQITYKLQG